MEQLIKDLLVFRNERNWQKFHNPKDLAIAISVEAAELLELFQWRPNEQPVDSVLQNKLENEIADVLLYLLLLADAAKIDILFAAQQKLERNKLRFPISTSYGIAKPDDSSEMI